MSQMLLLAYCLFSVDVFAKLLTTYHTDIVANATMFEI